MELQFLNWKDNFEESPVMSGDDADIAVWCTQEKESLW